MKLAILGCALALTLGPTTACGQARTDDDMAASIQEAKAKHVDSLMALPGVVSVGIGLNEAGEPAIVVGLETANAETEAAIGTTLEGHPVVVQVVGRIRAR